MLSRLRSTALLGVLLLSLVVRASPTTANADSLPDWPIVGGHFFTQTNGSSGVASGFSVVDDQAAGFWSEFQRLGGIAVLGYPISRRFVWDGFIVQAFQKAILQWRPEVDQAAFLNIFDRLSQAGQDDWLDSARSTPPSFDNSPDETLAWGDVVRRHLALLDVSPVIRASYFADPDPIAHYGLPLSSKDYGNVFVVRAQRAVLQLWRVPVRWAAAGQVVIANGGDNAKDAGVFPPDSVILEVAPSPHAANNHYGVVGDPTLNSSLSRLGASSSYSFGEHVPDLATNRVGQISLRPGGGAIVRVPLAELQAGARQNPGGFWLIGNEPNVPGQDEVTPEAYVGELKYYVDAIKGADPTALIVGPNVLNFDATCSGCTGMTEGHAWVDRFRAAWGATNGGEPPIDVWGIHAYTIDWDHLPMTDVTTSEAQIAAFSNYLAAVPTLKGKPVWLSEFGIVWGYDGYSSVTNGCPAAPNCIAPTGPLDIAAESTFLDQMLGWLSNNADRYRIDRWYVFTASGTPETYATLYGGISLLNLPSASGSLSPLGEIYRRYATS